MLKRLRFPIIRPKHVRVFHESNRFASWFSFYLDHGPRQRVYVILLPKNVQNIRSTQGAYFQLSRGLCMVERLHRSLHSGLSHYVNANHKNRDEVVPYYLMSHRSTPHTTTSYSPFYLLHWRKMILSNTDNLKACLPNDHTDEDQRLENLKSNLRLAYNLAAKANRK
jgi:hypothetical protein